MEKFKLVDKLKNKANISYEEAKDALEKSNWDMLEAMLYLEAHGKVQKPSISIFYTNESKESYNENGEEVNLKKIQMKIILKIKIVLKEFLKLYAKL